MLKVDFHVHSELSKDGRESLERIAEAAKLAGLDAVCVCDHNAAALDKITIIDGVALLPGCEISAAHEHIAAVLCDAPVDVEKLAQGGLPKAGDVIDEIKRCGGIAVIAHPFAHVERENWNGEGLKPDAVELYNARAGMKCKDADKLALAYAKSIGAACIGGSDAHLAAEIGNAYTLVDCNDVSEIKAAVLARKTEAVLKADTKRIYKGLSQMTRAKKEGGFKRRVLALCVFAKCVLLDIVGK